MAVISWVLLSLPWIILQSIHAQAQGQQCASGFPGIFPQRGRNTYSNGGSFVASILIPGMNFTCDGTITRMTVGGMRRLGNQTMKLKLRIWKKIATEPGIYHRSGKAIVLALNNNMCNERNKRCTLQLTGRKQISVEPGDILGIEVPPRDDADFELHSVSAAGLTNYIFRGTNLRSRVDLDDSIREVEVQPLIMFGMRWRNPGNPRRQPTSSDQSISRPTTTLTSTSPSAATGFDGAMYIIGLAVGIITALLLIVIITVMVIGFIRKHRRKNSWGIPTFPNSAYGNNRSVANGDHNAETIMDSGSMSYKAALDASNARVIGADYDEIKDEQYIEIISSEKPLCHFEDKSVEFTKSSNECFTLMPQEAQADTIANLVNQAADYESYKPSDRQCNFEDEAYWEPADSVNELYRQLSSKKYREIVPNQLQLTGVLGSGEFGRVSKGVWESPMGGMDVAVKQLQPGASEEEKVKFLQEAAINGQFRHPNVVKLMGVVTTGEPIMIVLELLSRGDLKTFLKQQQPNESQKSSANQQVLLRFYQQVASGMDYLSSKKDFIHRDLAARNILVSDDHICKISDFGMSRNLMDESYYISHGGKIPVKWTAPEAIHYKKYSSASDVWSFGYVMYEIWSLGHELFESYTNPDVINMVDKGYRLPPPPGLTRELYKIMMQCWQPESSRRPTFSQLVEMLSQADFELFSWEEEELKGCDQRVKVIGAPLELAQNLYTDLQNMYK